MNTRNVLRVAQDAVTECERGSITADGLVHILDFFGRNAREARALPGPDNAALRAVGARMDGWLRSIRDPEVMRSPALLLLRLRQVREAVEDRLALEDERDCAIPTLPRNVIAFPTRGAAAWAGLPA